MSNRLHWVLSSAKRNPLPIDCKFPKEDYERLLEAEKKSTNLLSIVVNSRGASDASSFEKIRTIGYPLSISEKFQLSNTKMKIHESLILVDEIFNKCIQKNKNFQVYFSMAFGNPYNESFNIDKGWSRFVLIKTRIKNKRWN